MGGCINIQKCCCDVFRHHCFSLTALQLGFLRMKHLVNLRHRKILRANNTRVPAGVANGEHMVNDRQHEGNESENVNNGNVSRSFTSTNLKHPLQKSQFSASHAAHNEPTQSPIDPLSHVSHFLSLGLLFQGQAVAFLPRTELSHPYCKGDGCSSLQSFARKLITWHILTPH